MNKMKCLCLRQRGFPETIAAATLVLAALPAKSDSFLGPANPGFENGSQNWNTGGTGGAAGSVNFVNSPTNGPSAPGTNCVLQTSDGSGNVDLRADYFSLGAASLGTNSLRVDFDYNILDPIISGNQIRVGLRFEDSNGGFLGEYNFHIGTVAGDTGGQGWKHFTGFATPVSTAVNADIRISMNIFGDDTWASGGVLFDNFSVQVTRKLGPSNPGFENGTQSWHAGGPGGAAGSVSFANPGTNGLSALGTNCVLETSDGSLGPTGNGVDFRADNFSLGTAANGAKPVTFSFDYNILGPVQSGDQIRVGLRFEDSGGGFLAENNSFIGTPNGDMGAEGWKHFSVTTAPSGTAQTADIRVSMNIFGDDTWSGGPVLFDNFAVAVGANSSPVVSDLTMGTLTGLAVTRLVVGGPQGATDADGDTLTVSYLSQPSHGAATTDGQSVTYVPNSGYSGTDQFTFAVSDGVGGLATAAATVKVNSGPGLNRFTNVAKSGANSYALTFSGAAFCDYVLQSAGSLVPPVVWNPQVTNAADGTGLVLFTNSRTGLFGFWRTRLLP